MCVCACVRARARVWKDEDEAIKEGQKEQDLNNEDEVVNDDDCSLTGTLTAKCIPTKKR